MTILWIRNKAQQFKLRRQINLRIHALNFATKLYIQRCFLLPWGWERWRRSKCTDGGSPQCPGCSECLGPAEAASQELFRSAESHPLHFNKLPKDSCAFSSLRWHLRGKNVSIWIKMVDQIYQCIPQRHRLWGWIWMWRRKEHQKVREWTWNTRIEEKSQHPTVKPCPSHPAPRTDCTLPTRAGKPTSPI